MEAMREEGQNWETLRFVDGEWIAERGYPKYDRHGNLTDPSEYPHGDKPYRHAEVKASSRILNFVDGIINGQEAPVEGQNSRPVAISDLQVDNRFTLKDSERRDRWPCCANCGTTLSGARVPRAGRIAYDPLNPNPGTIYDD